MTPPTTQTGDWEKRFDEFYLEDGFSSDATEVKSFIRSEITKAVEAEREKTIKEIMALITDDYKKMYGSGKYVKFESRVLNLITTLTKEE